MATYSFCDSSVLCFVLNIPNNKMIQLIELLLLFAMIAYIVYGDDVNEKEE